MWQRWFFLKREKQSPYLVRSNLDSTTNPKDRPWWPSFLLLMHIHYKSSLESLTWRWRSRQIMRGTPPGSHSAQDFRLCWGFKSNTSTGAWPWVVIPWGTSEERLSLESCSCPGRTPAAGREGKVRCTSCPSDLQLDPGLHLHNYLWCRRTWPSHSFSDMLLNA